MSAVVLFVLCATDNELLRKMLNYTQAVFMYAQLCGPTEVRDLHRSTLGSPPQNKEQHCR